MFFRHSTAIGDAEFDPIAFPLSSVIVVFPVDEISIQCTRCSSWLYPTMAAASSGPKRSHFAGQSASNGCGQRGSLHSISMTTLCGAAALGPLSVPSKCHRPAKAFTVFLPQAAPSGIRS